jgi:hypothetical protein
MIVDVDATGAIRVLLVDDVVGVVVAFATVKPVTTTAVPVVAIFPIRPLMVLFA